MNMRVGFETILWTAAVSAAAAVWIPGLPWPAAAFLVFPVALVVPGWTALTLTGARPSPGIALASSPILLAATAWAFCAASGDLDVAARLALAAWTLAGLAASRRSRLPSSDPHPLAGAGLAVAGAMFLLVAAPLAMNPSLATRPAAAIFLPLLGEAAGGALPPSNPFLTGSPGALPWSFAALLAPLLALTRLPAAVLVPAFQLAGLAAFLLCGLRWISRAGGAAWAQAAWPVFALGGLGVLGFRHASDLAELTSHAYGSAWLHWSSVAFTGGNPAAAGLLPAALDVGPTVWALAALAAAGALAGAPAHRGRFVILGLALGAAAVLQPMLGLVGGTLWAVYRIAGGPRAGARWLEVAAALLIAVPAALYHAGTMAEPLALRLPAGPLPGPGGNPTSVLGELVPLLLAGLGGLFALPARRPWIAAAIAAAALALVFSATASTLLAVAWVSLLFAGIPAALGLDRWAPGRVGPPLAAAMLLCFLVTPTLYVRAAWRDDSGRTRWNAEERAMLRRAERALPLDTVLLYPTTDRVTSEAQLLLARGAYLGPPRAVRIAAGLAPRDEVAEESARRALVGRMEGGRRARAVLDSIAAAVAPRTLAYVVSSEDMGRHPDLLEFMVPTIPRFEAVENSQTLKVLRYVPPAPPAPVESAPAAGDSITTPPADPRLPAGADTSEAAPPD